MNSYISKMLMIQIMMSVFSKMTLTPIIYLSPMLSLSLNSYFSSWLILEVSTMAFIILLSLSSNIFSKWEAPLMYFLIQSLTSALLMMAFMLLYSTLTKNSQLMINLILFTKMGIPPFHSWLPWIMKKMSWHMCFILTTMQKTIPLIILEAFPLPKMTFFIAMITVSLTSIMIVKNSLMKSIMAYSSISHSAWMIVINMMSMKLMILYFMIYSMISWSLFSMFTNLNILTISDLNKLSIKMKWIQKITSLSLLMSLGGLPPFTGFLIKMYAILSIKMQSMILIWMMLTSLINLVVYLRIWMNMMFIFQSNNVMTYHMNINHKFSFNSNMLLLALFTFWVMSYIVK